MKVAPLDEQYLQWLYGQIGPVSLKNPSQTYWSLLRLLYKKEFIWIIPNDDNRGEDGKDLRYEFTAGWHRQPDSDWMDLPCSVLEMLIALSRKLSFEAGREPADWFWELIDNLGLTECNDRSFFSSAQEIDVDVVLDVWLKRAFTYDGGGGIFPLRKATEDQRDVEIWFQMGAYLLERE